VSGCCLSNIAYPISETIANSVTAEKSGTACQSAFLGIVYTGDASIEAAKKVGDITNVHNIDGRLIGVINHPNIVAEYLTDPMQSPPFALYYEKCTIVHGE
jgi:TRL-like protein family